MLNVASALQLDDSLMRISLNDDKDQIISNPFNRNQSLNEQSSAQLIHNNILNLQQKLTDGNLSDFNESRLRYNSSKNLQGIE